MPNAERGIRNAPVHAESVQRHDFTPPNSTPAELLRILLVDDDAVDRRTVRRGLRTAGIHAEFADADEVESAVRMFTEDEFDCAFLDFHLPGGDGLQVLREVRERGVRTPIIMLTGQGDEQLAVELMKAGASDYLSKSSLSPERLEQSLRYVVHVYRAEQQAWRAEAALRESREWLATTLRSIGDAVLTTDTQGRVTFMNPVAETLTGWTAAEALGQPLGQVVRMLDATTREPLDNSLDRVLREGAPIARDDNTLLLARDGTEVPVDRSAAPIRDDNGTAIGVVLAFRDIAERKRVQRELETAMAARGRFYAAMSHELRTPINAVIGYNDLLLAEVYGALAPQQLQGIERSQKAARHLLELVNDVLDLSKLEAGKLEIETEPIRMGALVEDLLTTIRPLADQHGCELLIENGCPEPVTTDPRRVRQILLNLLSNAIKFGAGKPVYVRCEPAEAGGVSIAVSDQGPGIAPADVPRIFEEFVQLGTAAQSGTGGTGLGLPISTRLAELLGGRLEVESTEGCGSIFRLILPRDLQER